MYGGRTVGLGVASRGAEKRRGDEVDVEVGRWGEFGERGGRKG